MNKQHLRAAAESFAGISDIESACYHYTESGHADIYRAGLSDHYTIELLNRFPNLKSTYLVPVIQTALTELTYPVLDGKLYAWSANERAAFAGTSKATWSRNNLSEYVNFIIEDIRSKSRYTLHLVEDNIRGRSAFA